jgi:hypothetical protein
MRAKYMPNTYLVEWQVEFEGKDSRVLGSTAELLDFFDHRVRREADHFIYSKSKDLDDFNVVPLVGSTNPLEDVYEIARFANEREPGAVIEGPLLAAAPTLWVAAFRAEGIFMNAFGSEPHTAFQGLVQHWKEAVDVGAISEPALLYENAASIHVRQVTIGSTFSFEGNGITPLVGDLGGIKGDEPIFAELLDQIMPQGSHPGLQNR